jgi:hypothetical protein
MVFWAWMYDLMMVSFKNGDKVSPTTWPFVYGVQFIQEELPGLFVNWVSAGVPMRDPKHLIKQRELHN